jgi:PAS domain S-box-containing protein
MTTGLADGLLAAQVREVLDALPDGVAVHVGGVFVFANPAAERILGYERGELVGRPVLDVAHPDEHGDISERMRTLVGAGLPVPLREERLVGKDGRQVVCLVRGIPVQWGGGDAALLIAQDVTELRRFEERLIMADRLASVGTLAAGMAHDLNNPLAALVLALDLARELAGDGGPIPADRADRIRQRLIGASSAADRLKDIVGDLRVYARQPEDNERLIDLAAPLRSALDLAGNEIRHRCRVELDLEDAPKVLASEGRMVQVFVNLLTNAIHAFPPDRPSDANLLRVGCATVYDRVRVSVEDNGVGIPPELVSRVFEPYFTTKPSGQGTGLGLWMVEGVVRRLGGQVVLHSQVGKGTRVEVYVPVGGADPPAVEPAPIPHRERRRVLIVDDEPEIGQLLAEVLRPEHEVEVFTRGADGLARMLHGTHDLAICDLMMPDLGGRELYEALVADGRGLERRLLFATGGAFTQEASAFLDRVDVRVLHKPFRLADVRALVAAWPSAT